MGDAEELVSALVEEALLPCEEPRRTDVAFLSEACMPDSASWPDRPVLALRGMPGAGKTTHLRELAARLGRDPEQRRCTLALDCADVRFSWLGDALPMLPVLAADAFFRARPRMRAAQCTFLLDNVDAVPQWRQAVSRVVDTYGARFYVTLRELPAWPAASAGEQPGAAMDGARVGAAVSSLADGQACDVRMSAPTTCDALVAWREVGPLPFKRCLACMRSVAGLPEIALREADALDSYLMRGGLPGAVLADGDDAARRHLQSLAGEAALRAGQGCGPHAVGPAAARLVAARALAQSGEAFSVTACAQRMREAGTACTRQASSSVLRGLERQGLLAGAVPLGCEDAGAHRVSRTLYAADPGLAAAHMPPGPLARQRLMKTAAYLELCRRAGTDCPMPGPVRVSPGRFVDFGCEMGPDGTPGALVHVVDEASDTRALQRAARLLGHAMLRCGLERATLLTSGVEREVPVEAGSVRAVPLWRWLLEG